MESQINLDRLKRNLKRLADFGYQPKGGITREPFGMAEREAKTWLIGKMEEAGIRTRTDEAGNVFGRIGPEGSVIMTGSHLDTVPSGGMFDGALGIMAALECLQTIRENHIPVRHPIEMVAFSDEEGTYHGCLGSQALIGVLDVGALEKAKNMQGKPLKEAMAECGLDMHKISLAAINTSDIKAYLELHPEQGPQLDHRAIPIGIPGSIVGSNWYWITFTGEANHAGTTPMGMRKDAFLGASDFALRVNEHITSGSDGVVTIGDVRVFPGVFNIIPGEVRLALEFRNSSEEKLRKMDSDILNIGKAVAREKGLNFNARRTSGDTPVLLSERIRRVIQKEADALGYTSLQMDSGAGHDAQVMALITEAGMIFIPSIGGKSHCPEEKSGWDDVHKGAQLLLGCILALDSED